MNAPTHLTRILATALAAIVLAATLLAATAGNAWASDARAIGDNLVSIEADDGAGVGAAEVEFFFGDPGDDPFGSGKIYLRNSNNSGSFG